MSESINEYLSRVTESTISEACKKSGASELYKTDIAKFLLALSPMDRVQLIDSVNKYDREATLEWALILSNKIHKLDQADGYLATMQNELSPEAEG